LSGEQRPRLQRWTNKWRRWLEELTCALWPAPCETEMATPLSCQISTSSEMSELVDERRGAAQTPGRLLSDEPKRASVIGRLPAGSRVAADSITTTLIGSLGSRNSRSCSTPRTPPPSEDASNGANKSTWRNRGSPGAARLIRLDQTRAAMGSYVGLDVADKRRRSA